MREFLRALRPVVLRSEPIGPCRWRSSSRCCARCSAALRTTRATRPPLDRHARRSTVRRWRRIWRCWALATAAAPLAARCAGAPLPPIRHVFVVMLENQPFDNTFGAKSQAPYLKSLAANRARWRSTTIGTSHASLGNYLALISGQAPNEEHQFWIARSTRSSSAPAPPRTARRSARVACTRATVTTLANQLEAAHLTWKGYMEDMGNNPRRESATCGHPPIGAPDNTQSRPRSATSTPRGTTPSYISTPSSTLPAATAMWSISGGTRRRPDAR